MDAIANVFTQFILGTFEQAYVQFGDLGSTLNIITLNLILIPIATVLLCWKYSAF